MRFVRLLGLLSLALFSYAATSLETVDYKGFQVLLVAGVGIY